MRRDEYINLHGFAGILYHHPTQSPSSYKVRDHNKKRLTLDFSHNHPLTLLFHHYQLPLFTPRPPIKQLFGFKPALIPSTPVYSPQIPTTISRTMDEYSFSSPDASVSTRHGSSPQSYGFGALLQVATFWNCCNCSNMNNELFAKKACSSCGHKRCASCGTTYST